MLRESPVVAAAVQIKVNGPGGPRCSVQATTEWTILQVHDAIHEQLKVPVFWQTLLLGTKKLAWEVAIGSLISEDRKTLQLTLLVHEVPLPEPRLLQDAIDNGNEAQALRLLQLPQLPIPDARDWAESTVLHLAIDKQMPAAARAIAARADFPGINRKNRYGLTPLHLAAGYGFLPVCAAILGNGSFTQLHATDVDGRTALEWAQSIGHPEVAALLQGRPI